jgi:hypothetical protein
MDHVKTLSINYRFCVVDIGQRVLKYLLHYPCDFLSETYTKVGHDSLLYPFEPVTG